MSADLGSHWPPGTTHTPQDVVVDGTSLATMAAVVETPFVVRCNGRRSLVLTSVDMVVAGGDDFPMQVWVDADLPAHALHADEARAIACPEGALVRGVLRSALTSPHSGIAHLPATLVPGDVLVIPCTRVVSQSEIVF